MIIIVAGRADVRFLSLRQAAKPLGVGHATIHRRCQRHHGFGQLVDGRWRIPAAHIDRVLEGETAAQVSRSPSVSEGDETGFNAAGAATVVRAPQDDAERARRQLVQTYFCLLAARHHADEISVPSQDRLLGALASNTLDAMKALGPIEVGSVRIAIAECDAPAEFRALTGVRVVL